MDNQLIKIWNKLRPEDKLAIFRETGERAGLPATAIEKDWEADYSTMRESMIYGASKTFQELITSMKRLMERFRKIADHVQSLSRNG